MFRKKRQNEGVKYSENGLEDDIEFDWTDILAFIIATFQVLFPYVIGVIGSYLVVVFLLSLWIK